MSGVIDQAMILAAGLGTRMNELTADRPKAMVEVAGRPLIDHAIDRLKSAGIKRIVVNVHYCADVLERHLATRSDVDIYLSDERHALLDTGGGIKHALHFFEGRPFVTHNCDTIWAERETENLSALLAQFDPEKMDALMLLALRDTSLGFDGKGDFFMSDTGALQRRGNADAAPFVWAGVQVIVPDLFEQTPDTAFSTNIVWDRAIRASRLYGLALRGTWMHVGSPDAVTDAEAYLSEF